MTTQDEWAWSDRLIFLTFGGWIVGFCLGLLIAILLTTSPVVAAKISVVVAVIGFFAGMLHFELTKEENSQPSTPTIPHTGCHCMNCINASARKAP